VAEAHVVGIIHRDIKPANLFLARTRSKQLVKVLDFGISKVPEPERDDDLHATAEDTVLGTPHFMSPEQLRNPAKIDVRTDIWSLGVTLFYLLTGELPFRGETRREITAAIFVDEPHSLRDFVPDAPEALADAIAGALVKRPEERTAGVLAFAEALVPFASKRGRDAAEQLSGTAPPAAPPLARRASKEMTTEDGLASTLPATGEVEPVRAPDPSSAGATTQTEPSPRRGLAVLAAIVALGGVGAVWMLGDSQPADESKAAAASAEPPTVRPTVEPAAADSPVPPEPSATTTATASSQTSAAAAAPPSPRARSLPPPRPRTTARAQPSAAPAASARPSVDIDGVPILQ